MMRLLLWSVVLFCALAGAANAACTSPTGAASQTRYDFGTNALYYCNNSTWISLGGGALSSLSDVSATGPVSGYLLRYNGSKWESVGASTALSTTTIYTNWPDAILCDGSSGKVVVYNEVINFGNGLHYYNTVGASGSTIRILFNSDGSYNSYSNGGYAGYFENCTSGAWSIQYLYSIGRAFNFIGSSLSSAAAPANSVQYNNAGVLAGSGITYISSSGNIGISQANPQAALDVNGTASATTVSTGKVLFTDGTSQTTKAYTQCTTVSAGFAANSYGSVSCPAGYQLISGGYSCACGNGCMAASTYPSGSTWYAGPCFYYSGTPYGGTVYAQCCR